MPETLSGHRHVQLHERMNAQTSRETVCSVLQNKRITSLNKYILQTQPPPPVVLDGTCGSKEYSAPPCTSSKCLPVDQPLMSCSHTGLDSKTQSRALHFALHNIGSPYHVVKKSEHHSPSIPVKKILKQTNPPHRHKFITHEYVPKKKARSKSLH